MPRTQLETQYLGQFGLSASTVNRQTFNFPLGELIYGLHLRIAATLTVGSTPSGGVAYEDPLLEIIQAVRLEVDRDGVLVNASSKALRLLAQILKGTAPNMDEANFAANTAGAYAMSCHIPIYFADPRMARPEDTALATDRYSTMALSITMGAGSDALSTAHTSGGGITLSSMTCDVEWVRLRGPIPDGARPIVAQKIAQEGSPFNPSNTTRLAFQHTPKRALKRVLIGAYNLANASRPWSGNGSNSILSTLQLESDEGLHEDNRRAAQVQDEGKLEYGQESWPEGLYTLDFVDDGSTFSALSTGDKSRLELVISQASSPPSGTNNVSVVAQAVEELG